MADYIKYDYHLNPGTEVDDKNANYHVRINGNTILDNAEISERLVRECTLSKADIAAVLVGLKDVVVDALVHGNAVSLDGICKIEPILGVEDGDCTGKEDGRRIGLKAVRLRASKKLTEEVRENLKPCVRHHCKHSASYTEIELYRLLTDFFKDNDTLTRNDLEHQYGLTRYMATKFINQFVAEGRLLRPRVSGGSEYRPAPGFFGKKRG